MPPADERFRHLFLAGTTQALPFTTPNQGGRRSGPLARDPDRHGQALSSDLSRVAETEPGLAELRRSHGLEEVTGTPVTFELVLNPTLSLESLEDKRAGIELLSFQPTRDDMGVAVVFVPEGKLAVFERKLEAYLDPEKRGHQRLINSIERIRRTVLQDLWTDPLREFPGDQGPIWWEVWVRNQAGVDRFRAHAERLAIRAGRQALRFPDRTVVLAWATVGQMALSIDLLDSIAELREARSLAVELLEMHASTEAERVADLRSRTEPPPDDSPAVCLLDTGIDIGHPLLEPGLEAEDAHSYDEANWGIDDHEGHGTGMGGFALYGADLDRLLLSEEQVELRHRLESVKILPRQGNNPPELYGEIVLASAARVESHEPLRRRAYSLSVTAGSCPEGRPTSWSGAIDQLCMGAEEENEGAPRRLVFVSSGNAAIGEGYSYPDWNHTDCIQDPAQAWNAITVGAYTEKDLIHEADYRDWEVVAPTGDMSPCNTTSLTWREEWPQKPDLVLEGGNMAWDPTTGLPDSLDSLSLLTTKRRIGSGLTCWSGDTSGANATAARMGALVLAEYADLDLWPETVRALLVHSGRWTPAMRARFAQHSRRERMNQILRCYGYGVPDLDRALYSLRHQLTLVIQERIQPFRIEGAQAKANEMHLHRIPWPADVLADLGETSVRMRITLSYFIEPKPGQRGASRRYRYASHLLRFDVKTALEADVNEFLARINKAARDREEAPSSSSSDSAEWLIGPRFRNRGSVHSDVWRGTAADLATKDAIAVFPVLGWWRNTRYHDRCERSVRYSLLVSIETDAAEVEVEGVTQSVDFYTEVVNAIEVAPEIEIIGG